MANAPKWTDEQLSAIEARGENLLLSAAAGSGKTTVLVERVLRLVLEDGAAAGIGNHEALMRDCEAYRQIARIQMGGDDHAAA